MSQDNARHLIVFGGDRAIRYIHTATRKSRPTVATDEFAHHLNWGDAILTKKVIERVQGTNRVDRNIECATGELLTEGTT